jgi:hypothetical protein
VNHLREQHDVAAELKDLQEVVVWPRRIGGPALKAGNVPAATIFRTIGRMRPVKAAPRG